MDRDCVASRWRAVRAGLIETIDKFQDGELEFKPFPASRSLRGMMLHVAHEEHGEFDYGVARTIDAFPDEYAPAAYPTIESIKTLLDAVHAPVITYISALTQEDLDRVITTPWGTQHKIVEMLDHIIEHEIHHRGELSLVLGMLGREGLDA